MIKVGSRLDIAIASIAENGYGICFYKGNKILVKQALAKEKGTIQIVKRVKEGYIGEWIFLKEKHPMRQEVNCCVYQNCGSCHLLHMQYDATLQLKKQYVQDLLKHYHLQHIQIHRMIAMEHPYAYRNKIIVGFTRNRKNQIEAGFYEEYSHRVVAYDSCLLHEERSDAIIQTVKQLIKQFKISLYEEDKRRGLLRHLIIREGKISKQWMVVLVLASNVFPARKEFVNALLKQHPYITTVVQNVNKRKTSIVLGDEERILYGKGYIEDELCGYNFQISSKSFYQINQMQCEKLYKHALSLCNLSSSTILFDAYCGIGTIGIYASQFVKKVIGVELNKNAVQDARENAKRNQVKNISFIADDATQYIEKMVAKKQSVDVIVMDPPRSGSSKEFIYACAKLRPKEIVYISCNPQTMMRDLKWFQTKGYESKEIDCVDMFPWTMHVESVCLLSRKEE